MHPVADHHRQLTRRALFGRTATGVGTAALASLMARDGLAAEGRKAVGGLPGLPHFAPKAKLMLSPIEPLKLRGKSGGEGPPRDNRRGCSGPTRCRP